MALLTQRGNSSEESENYTQLVKSSYFCYGTVILRNKEMSMKFIWVEGRVDN